MNGPGSCADEPDARDPWEGRLCGECRHLKWVRIGELGDDVALCAQDADEMCEADPRERACEGFE